MGQVAIINAPSSFTWIWSIMKPWMSKETQAKVNVLGSNFQAELLEMVDAENLPRSLGGTCTCGAMDGESERCALSGVGPWLEGRKGWGPNAQAKKESSPVVHANGAAAVAVSDMPAPSSELREVPPSVQNVQVRFFLELIQQYH